MKKIVGLLAVLFVVLISCSSFLQQWCEDVLYIYRVPDDLTDFPV